MKSLLFVLGMSLTLSSQAQGECQKVYVSHHFVLNTTSDTVTIWVDNRNQKSFPTKGPKQFSIAPNERIEVSELGWAEEFRDPTTWYIFKVEPEGLTNLCDAKNWKFKKLSETQSEYSLTLEPSDDGKCIMLKKSMINRELIPDREALEKQEEIYDFADPEAQFPGGPEKMQIWINDNVRYPQQAIEDSTSGKVYVQFVVEKTGELSNIRILRSAHGSLSKESIRLIKAMPKWDPGLINGEAVRVRYIIPIVFRLG